jgi:hypothetical protein
MGDDTKGVVPFQSAFMLALPFLSFGSMKKYLQLLLGLGGGGGGGGGFG